MGSYEEARVLTNNQLKKIESAAKNETGSTLRITKKNFQYEELHHELILTAKEKAKINAFPKNMSKDVRHCKAQLCRIFGYFVVLF